MQTTARLLKYMMVAANRIVHQFLHKGCISHEVIRIGDELECCFELIHKLFERLLEVLNNLEEVVRPLAILNLENVNLCESFGQILKRGDIVRRQLLEPCDRPFIQTSRKNFA